MSRRAVPQCQAQRSLSALGARCGLVGRQPRATARRPAAMAGLLLCLTAALAVGQAGAEVYMKETFGGESLDGWEPSSWKGATCTEHWQTAGRESCMGRWELTAGAWSVDAEAQQGLRTTENMAFHAISKPFDKPFSNRNKVRRCTLRFERSQTFDCLHAPA
jgi:hypothetical protein